MIRNDYGWIGLLTLLALFIWIRDTAWMSSAEDTLPILVSLPMMYWMGTPWVFKNQSSDFSFPKILLGSVIFLAGIALNLTTLLTIAWTYFLWIWLSSRVEKPDSSSLKKLMVLAFLAFPWIGLDFTSLGWWFRLSAAWVTAQVFTLAGQEVTQAGTNLVINNIPFSVDVACAGLNTLQSMLIAGTAIAYILLGNSNKFWWNLPLLIVMAWLANTLRIILLTLTALAISPEFALGFFHTFGGWLVIITMFGLCALIFYLQAE